MAKVEDYFTDIIYNSGPTFELTNFKIKYHCFIMLIVCPTDDIHTSNS